MTHVSVRLAEEESDFLRAGFLALGGPRRDFDTFGAACGVPSASSSSTFMGGVPDLSAGSGSMVTDGSVASGNSTERFLLPLPGPPLRVCSGGPGMAVTLRLY